MDCVVVIKDGRVLSDLKNGGLLEPWFELGIPTILTESFCSEARRNEEEFFFRPFIDQNSIEIDRVSDEMAGAWLVEVSKLSRSMGISFADATALICAQERDALLLSSYGKMKGKLSKKGFVTIGAVWVLDVLLTEESLSFRDALKSLKNIRIEGGYIPERMHVKRQNCWNNGKKIVPVGWTRT